MYRTYHWVMSQYNIRPARNTTRITMNDSYHIYQCITHTDNKCHTVWNRNQTCRKTPRTQITALSVELMEIDFWLVNILKSAHLQESITHLKSDQSQHTTNLDERAMFQHENFQCDNFQSQRTHKSTHCQMHHTKMTTAPSLSEYILDSWIFQNCENLQCGNLQWISCQHTPDWTVHKWLIHKWLLCYLFNTATHCKTLQDTTHCNTPKCTIHKWLWGGYGQ